MYLNQSFEQILSLLLFLGLCFIFSNLICFLFLKIKSEFKIGTKTIIPNFIFYSIIFISYLLAIHKNINIAVFSPNESYEKKWLIAGYVLTYIFATFCQVYLYNSLSKEKLLKSYIKLLWLLNFITLSIIYISFYPRPYVSKDIKYYERFLYLPNKFDLELLDKSIVKIDTACSSENIYVDNKDLSYILRIPLIQTGSDRMLYSFRLLDKSVEIGTSEEEENCKSISVNMLGNEIAVILVQKNPDPNIGWEKEIVTDTILFKKTRTEKRNAGYYHDTNCDCIQY